MNKRILVTSIPSWNQKTGSDTLSSLFASFDSSDLSNIYISGDIPDSPVCSRYFHIDEISVVKSVKPNVNANKIYITRKIPPPSFAARYGNLQIFPSPTALPAAASTKPKEPENEFLFSFIFILTSHK